MFIYLMFAIQPSRKKFKVQASTVSFDHTESSIILQLTVYVKILIKTLLLLFGLN